ncbi:hypothetical protein BJV78DRAFT_1355677 [Lactifluus subvellereus]|nr:hypothetical protein BJV78DRAFT_1355677 [Lactifluus subvellereus]
MQTPSLEKRVGPMMIRDVSGISDSPAQRGHETGRDAYVGPRDMNVKVDSDSEALKASLLHTGVAALVPMTVVDLKKNLQTHPRPQDIGISSIHAFHSSRTTSLLSPEIRHLGGLTLVPEFSYQFYLCHAGDIASAMGSLIYARHFTMATPSLSSTVLNASLSALSSFNLALARAACQASGKLLGAVNVKQLPTVGPYLTARLKACAHSPHHSASIATVVYPVSTPAVRLILPTTSLC